MRQLLLIILTVFSISSFAQSPLRALTRRSQATVTYDTIVVNFYDSASSNRGKITRPVPDLYNNYSVDLTSTATSNKISKGLSTKSGTVTGIQIQWTANTGTVDGYSDNTGGGSTPTYGAGNTLGFTDSVFQVARYSTQTPSTLTITGLDNAKTYNIAIVGSRNNATARSVTYTIGSGVTINAALNLTNAVVFTNKSPSSGTITCTITFANTFSYVNAVKIWYQH